MCEVVEGMSHLREPRVVNMDVLDGVEGAPYRVVAVDDVMVVGAADVRRVVGVIDRTVTEVRAHHRCAGPRRMAACFTSR